MDVTVDKAELLEIVRDNRAKHRQVFEAALDGYRRGAEKILEDKIKSLSEGRSPEIRINISRPEDHSPDYTRIITMLEMDLGDTYTLDEQQFAQYVMDDWRWKRDWLRMSNTYAAGATQQVYGVSVEDDDDYA